MVSKVSQKMILNLEKNIAGQECMLRAKKSIDITRETSTKTFARRLGSQR